MFLKKQVVLLELVLMLVLASCSTSELGNNFPAIAQSFITSVMIDDFNVFALSPDRETVTDYAFTQTNLTTGEQTQLFLDTLGLDSYGSTGGLMGWSIDGRYLAATQIVYAPDSAILDKPVVIIDTTTNTARYYPGVFNGWSAVNSERFMTNNFTPTNVSDGSEVLPWKLIDYRDVAVKGYGEYLWDANQNLPIAHMTWNSQLNSDGTETGRHVNEIVSYDKGRTIHVPVYTEKPLQRTVNTVFDPTGQYILLTVWERSKIPAAGNDEISGENVIDSVLILVDWRTGKQVELFRLSSIDSKNLIAKPSGTAWSADGSTVFIARNDAPAIVLKMKYP